MIVNMMMRRREILLRKSCYSLGCASAKVFHILLCAVGVAISALRKTFVILPTDRFAAKEKMKR